MAQVKAVKLLVKMAGPDGVHMPGEIVYVPAVQAERLRAAGVAIGPNDPMPEPQKASDLCLQASGTAEAPEASRTPAVVSSPGV